jgi:hypothetical protein
LTGSTHCSHFVPKARQPVTTLPDCVGDSIGRPTRIRSTAIGPFGRDCCRGLDYVICRTGTNTLPRCARALGRAVRRRRQPGVLGQTPRVFFGTSASTSVASTRRSPSARAVEHPAQAIGEPRRSASKPVMSHTVTSSATPISTRHRSIRFIFWCVVPAHRHSRAFSDRPRQRRRRGQILKAH